MDVNTTPPIGRGTTPAGIDRSPDENVDADLENGRPDPNARRFGAFDLTALQIVASAAAALAYLFGVISVSAFASELGVSAADLGIDFRDYIILALLNTLFIVLAIAAAAGIQVAFVRAKGWVKNTIMAALVVILWLILGVVAAYLNVNFVTFWLATACLYAAYVSFEAADDNPKWRYAAIAFGLGAATLLAVNADLSARSYASEIREWASACTIVDCSGGAPTGPPGLTLILEPAVGQAVAADGERSCVVRVRDHVIVGNQLRGGRCTRGVRGT